MIRVLIVDDEQLVRTGLRLILEAAGDIVVVGEARDGAEAVNAVGRLRADVVLMDVRMPGLDGLTAAERVTRRLIGSFAEKGPSGAEAANERLTALTERERQVVRAVARGLSNAEIGRELTMREATVKAHVSRALAKLGLVNRVQAAILMHEAGLR
jgi:DNA-binding NarL/FixJ family response regulator